MWCLRTSRIRHESKWVDLVRFDLHYSPLFFSLLMRVLWKQVKTYRLMLFAGWVHSRFHAIFNESPKAGHFESFKLSPDLTWMLPSILTFQLIIDIYESDMIKYCRSGILDFTSIGGSWVQKLMWLNAIYFKIWAGSYFLKFRAEASRPRILVGLKHSGPMDESTNLL